MKGRQSHPASVDDQANPHGFRYGFLLLWLGVVCVTAVAVRIMEQNRARIQLAESRLQILGMAGDLRSRLESTLNAELALANAMVGAISIQPDFDQDDFELLAKEFMTHSSRIRNIGYAQGTLLKWVYPLEGNEQAIGLN